MPLQGPEIIAQSMFVETSTVRTKALLVQPAFNPNTFWSLTDACKLAKAKFTSPPLGLMTVAAMLPADWDVRLVDCNVSGLADADLSWADLVMTGGMLPQAPESLAILRRCQEHGVPVCLGGPDPTSRPEFYEAAGAELLVLGEAEGIMDAFIAAWRRGERKGRFVAPKFQADVTRTPLPRFDLIDFSDYLWVGVQFSRGCPFTCEFCDIIELYGRVPRTKTTRQMLAELDDLHARGYFGHVDFSDDNLIGNKKALKKFLPELIAWQKAHGYPFRFSTEASINLADDDELLDMMAQANFFIVFIGIESGDTATLISMQKKQNTKRSIADGIHKIYGAGMFVVAGFIVGFDTEGGDVAEAMVRTIEATSIPIAIVGLLTSLPNTQLQRRLEREGRLHEEWEQAPGGSGDQCTAGLNFETLRPRADVLGDYREVLQRIYTPDAFFERLNGVARALRRPRLAAAPNWPLIRKNLAAFGRLGIELLRRPRLLRPFLRFFLTCLRTNPPAVEFLLVNIAVYLHVGPFADYVIGEMTRRIDAMDAVARPAPATITAAA